MRCLVTGAAGFIGSHLCERLLADGHDVLGLDAFIPYYPRAVKEANLAGLRAHPRFTFSERDLRTDSLRDLSEGSEVAFHLAAMAGLVKSWTDFDAYTSCNLTATQRLLEALKGSPTLQRFLYASTSSVYGLHSSGDETLPTRPISPYGVTKLAAENLCRAYLELDVPVVVLRYFSVYGPRQRPDMGYYRFIDALLSGRPVTVYGDGTQVRGNTYVDDCIAASVAALKAPVGETYNVGGGATATVWQILAKLEKLLGCKAQVHHEPARPGDQRATFADTSKLFHHFGWRPQVGLDAGLAQQIVWQQHQARHSKAA